MAKRNQKANDKTRWLSVVLITVTPLLIPIAMTMDKLEIPWNSIGPAVIIGAAINLLCGMFLGGGWEIYEKRFLALQKRTQNSMAHAQTQDRKNADTNIKLANFEDFRNMLVDQLEDLQRAALAINNDPCSIEPYQIHLHPNCGVITR